MAGVDMWYAVKTSTSGYGPLTLIFCGHLLLLVVITLYAKGFTKWRLLAKTGGSNSSRKQLPQPWAKPAVIPGRTNHIRFSPQKHSFSYSYLLVGVPVGWSGRAGFLSVESSNLGLLSVKARDYLGRDDGDKSLREKLNDYLRSQGQDPSALPYVYLVTAPRVLGYSFNPVSFWYLFSSDRRLRAMILEVNNTFDERRLYFLEASNDSDIAGSVNFTASWTKDFHVSPFNDRDGSYSLLANDIGLQTSDTITGVSNTITLLSPEKQPKLVARVFSTQPPHDASLIGVMEILWLVREYGWVGFVTFPRIIREAWKLYFKRKLRVFFRPEVAQGTIGRTPTSIERNIEALFRGFLATCAEQCDDPISVTYKPAPGLATQQQYEFGKGTPDKQRLAVEVLTPAFYSRFVHYRNFREAMCEEGPCSDVRNRTVYISDLELLASILGQKKMDRSHGVAFKHMPYMEQLRWRFLDMLRCKPGTQAFPNEMTNASIANSSSSRNRFSALDEFAAQSTCEGWLYRRNVTQLFLAARFSGGFPGIIGLLDLACRICMVWLAITLALIMENTSYDTLGLQVIARITHCALFSSVHGWAMLKGVSALMIARRTHVSAVDGCRMQALTAFEPPSATLARAGLIALASSD